MNAPANIPQTRPLRVDETTSERAYRHAISIHCPNCDEMEMATRCDIAMLRDKASAGMMRASDGAAALLGEVSRLATMCVYAEAPASRLMRMRAALHLTMEAARAIERAQRHG